MPLGTRHKISGHGIWLRAPRKVSGLGDWGREAACTLGSGLEQGNCSELSYFPSGRHWIITTMSAARAARAPGPVQASLLEAGRAGNRGLRGERGRKRGKLPRKEQAPLGIAGWTARGSEAFWQDGVQVGSALQPPAPQRPGPAPRPTSGWNCCSVRVWQYWQASPFSHLPGSPHSSPCFTFGHGDDLVQREGRVTWTSGGRSGPGGAPTR